MFPPLSAYGRDTLGVPVINVLCPSTGEAMYRINKICMLAEFVI
jgi:hypothetical protein